MTSEPAPPQPQTLAEALVLIQALWAENARLHETVARLEQQVQTLAAKVGQNSTNSARPPSADPPTTPPPPPRRPTGRRRGAQPGHPAHQRAVLPPEQVDRTLDHYPSVCQHCQAPLAADPDHVVGEPLRHQVIEAPPVRVEVIDHYLHRVRCPRCRGATLARLPPDAPPGAFGPRLQAIVAMLSGRYRLSRREVAAVIEAMFTTSQLLATRGTPRQALTYLAGEGPVALRAELRHLHADLQLMPFEAALRAAQRRVADAAFDAFAVALIVNERYGSANLAGTLAQQARQALRLEAGRREAVAQYAANQASALVVIGALAVAGAAMMRLSPAYMQVYTTWWGQLLLAGYAAAFALAYALMMRIVRLPQEQRIVG